MKKILVPVDFSGQTEITCRYAIEFARPTGAEIMLFHTYFDQIILADSSFPDTLDMSTVYNEELMKDIFRVSERNMMELENRLSEVLKEEGITHISILSKVTSGELAHELKEVCQEFHPDLVVMGTTGEGRSAGVWGKVSTYIISHAKVPVLTVPDMQKFRGFGTIMLTTDLSDETAVMITGLLKIFAPFSFRIRAVHFLTRTKKTDEYTKMKELQQRFEAEEKKGLVTFEMVETEDDNQKAIDSYVVDRKIDLIAFYPHKRSLLYMMFTKNITKKNLYAAKVPLLAIPVKS